MTTPEPPITMLIDDAHRLLGWPTRAQIVKPNGEGPAVYADLVKRKIEAALRRTHPSVEVHTGVLSADPDDDATAAPLAVVCEFPRGATDQVLREAHRLAWNLSRSALLVTLEPHRIVAWSCCQTPLASDSERRVCTLDDTNRTDDSVRWMLHRVGLVTGSILRDDQEKFSAAGRADATLLSNLKIIRQRLREAGLPTKYCHDLLARVIFTQFLFHRCDREGRPFFDRNLLKTRCEGALEREHEDLASILRSKPETYRLFQWLNTKFNGDLFPGREEQTQAERKQAWREEKEAVSADHLRLLSDFVTGQIDAVSNQLALWPLYSFDVIPLEFISRIYEEFLGEDQEKHKAYYTESHIADYVLDAVLPWNSDQWDVKVLDPSCGSGIFLVKAFQRLIHRWRRSHPGRDPLVSDIKPILTNNLVGVDKHEEAVRVACFSLYLVMADAIEPRHYLKRDKVFPRLRGTRLLAHDFFDETKVGIRTVEDAGTYDLVIGNAPWGEDTIETLSEPDRRDMGKPGKRGKKKAVRTLAEAWATNHRWPVANKDMGPLFLPKGAALLKEAGSLAMIQSASVLHLRSQDAGRLREQLFDRFSFDEITNLSLVRDSVFSRRAYAAAAVLVFRNTQPRPDDELIYLCPKEQYDPRAQHTLALDPQDVHRITHAEAARVPYVWTALHLGGRRDLDLLLRLSRFSSLADHKDQREVKDQRGVKTRQGVIPGDKKKILDGRTEIRNKGKKKIEVTLPDLRGTHYLQTHRFPEGAFLTINQRDVPVWDEPRCASSDSTTFDAFRAPQLLVKMSYSRRDGRMRAARVRPVSSSPWGVICKKTYFSVHAPDEDGDRLLDAACVAFNSTIATWYLALTSSRLAFNRPEALVEELVGLPIPEGPVDLSSLQTFEDVDRCAERLYGLTEADTLLVDDCVRYKLPQAQSESSLSGHHPTRRTSDPEEDAPDVVGYTDCLLRVLRATFGRGRAISATVYEESGSTRLPVRLVVIELGGRTAATVDIEPLHAGGLMESLQEFHRQAMLRPGTGAGQRVAFLFDRREGARGVRLCIVKPDQQRYWMRSVALHDADEISGAILMGAARGRTKG